MFKPLANERPLRFVRFRVQRGDEILEGDVLSPAVRQHRFERLMKAGPANFIFYGEKKEAALGPSCEISAAARACGKREDDSLLTFLGLFIKVADEGANPRGTRVAAILDGLRFPACVRSQSVHGKRIFIERNVRHATEPGVSQFEVHILVKVSFGHSAGNPCRVNEDGFRKSAAGKILLGNDAFEKPNGSGTF